MQQRQGPVSPFREAVEQLAGVPVPGPGNRLDIQKLSEAFALFSETTQKLEIAHRELERRVQLVDAELERKNRELARANQDLQAKIAELDRMRAYLDNLIDSMGSGLICIDRQGRVTTMNRAAQQLTGWREEQVRDKNWQPLIAPESREAAGSLVVGLAVRQNVDLALLGKAGNRIPVRGTTAPIVDENGDPQGMILSFIDQSNVRLLEERVRRSGRLAALGELAAGMAHEMRNPLATIRGFIQIFPDESGDPEFRREFSVNVLREIDRLTRLTDDLLNLAKPSGMVLQPVDGGQLLAEVHLFLKEKLQKHGIETRLDLPKAPLNIPMDRNRIKQVLLNLILNAIEAMPSGGRLGLSLRPGREHLESSDREDPFAVYEVADSGIGIPADKLERIFDPFFTTKDSGTGLGLSVSHQIVEEHRGFLRVESAPGRGATFSLLLPLSRDGE